MNKRILTITAGAVFAAVVLTGCSSAGDTEPTKKPTVTKSAEAKATPTPSFTPTAKPAGKNLSFEDGVKLDAKTPPAWAITVSELNSKGWELTKTDSANGVTEYTKNDGTVVTVTQQFVTDLDQSMGDMASTQRLFLAAGYDLSNLEQINLLTYDDGIAQFLSVAGHDSSTDKWTGTVSRAFSKPKAALTLRITAASQEALLSDLKEFIPAAKVVVA